MRAWPAVAWKPPAVPGGRRAPVVADAVPVFALSPAYRLVPHDRSAGAGGTALRPRGISSAEAQEIGGTAGAAWPALGGGRAPPGRAPLPPAAGGLCSPDGVARAAEAADPARPP